MSNERSHQSGSGLDVLISGGSMGGLFTGIALARSGHRPTIYERSAGALKSRGGGIVAQRNIRRFLGDHDLVDPEAITTRSHERRFLDESGDVERAVSETMVFTSWDALYRQLRDAFPDERYRTGTAVTAVTPETATVTIDDGTERTADVVVSAEGGQSTTRAHLHPNVEPEFASYVAWRGVVDEAALPAGCVEAFDGTFTFYQGTDQLILAYFIPGPDGETERGSRRLNWVWYDTLDGRDRRAIFTDTSDTERRFSVSPGRLREPVGRRQRERAATLPPVFETLVGETPDLFVQAIYDLTVPAMVAGRACLLGDAAFVARPHTAAGTAKAAGDATALADALASHGSVDDALEAWGRTRTEYGTTLVARGKQMGDVRLNLD
ncbi:MULTISPECIES: FAD-dependent monooxygenase [unclassified Halorubrum]|uniref:FAD binding domain-containing protein n=1 Tax=unclassified Halorubrum TaxID=2642239 RepID=UPI000B9984A2|nr:MULTISPECIES: FAD-dependent monooxygenase [unclassified Halorubrum]OYR47427.1 FAD-dependent monooxygenase [Halorubrum sp. Eb13]OYR51910.1 FAD-dependent monooxygenase [Halorubrum sp. Ea1]